jgi:hypothetical protein
MVRRLMATLIVDSRFEVPFQRSEAAPVLSVERTEVFINCCAGSLCGAMGHTVIYSEKQSGCQAWRPAVVVPQNGSGVSPAQTHVLGWVSSRSSG